MKKVVLLFLLCSPVFAIAQEIKLNEVDGFTNDRTIETTIVTLKQGFSTGFGLSYTAVNKIYYLNIVGYGRGTTLVNDNDQVWLVLDDGSVIKCTARVNLDYTSDAYKNIYIHHYYISLDDVEVLKNNKVSLVRIVGPDGTKDISVSKKNSKNFCRLSGVFIDEVSK